MTRNRLAHAVIVLALGACTWPTRTPPMNEANDREAVLAHVRSIFEAFLRQDRETIRRTHSDDWTGFLGPSTRIERGVDAYMKHAEASLATFRGTGYELLETEVQVLGDVAIVFYVARYDYRDTVGDPGALPLRAIDLYRRQDGEWIQFGSHITPISADGPWGADPAR